MGVLDSLLNPSAPSIDPNTMQSMSGQINAMPVPALNPASHTYEEQDGKHQGIAGIGRDILGTLGDFLLTRLHLPAMYAPAQHQRELDAAWQGHEDDPQAAADRVASVDFNQGQNISKQIQNQQSTDAYRRSAADLRNSRMQAIQDAADTKNRLSAQAYLNTLFKPDGTPIDKFPEAYSQVKKNIAATYGARSPSIMSALPDDADPDQISMFVKAGIPVATAKSQDLRQQQIDNNLDLGTDRNEIGQQNADTAAARQGSYDYAVHHTAGHQNNQDAEASRRTEILGANAVTGAARAVTGAAKVSIDANKANQYKPGSYVTLKSGERVKVKGN